MTRLVVGSEHLQQTIGHLHAGGVRGCETAVLWLARYEAPETITEVYRPEQVVAADYFHISPLAMRRMMKHLRGQRMLIAAQVHSHPGRAYHSLADDRWAVVRHEGALSIVLPNFAQGITTRNFLNASAIYRLSSDNTWDPVAGAQVPNVLVVR